MNRREFFKTSALTGAALGVAPGSFSTLLKASDECRVGVLGSGARAQQLMQAAFHIPGVRIIGVCDAYRGRAEKARSMTGGEATIYDDYRRLLESDDIDAVIIGSPDHWHLKMCLDSLAAGKDVYIEKPLTYTIEEGLEIAEAVKPQSRVLQVGSQSISSATQQKAREIVASGRLGQITLVRASYNRNTASGAWLYPIPPDASPETVDWKAFLGSAPERPFDLERFFRWRCYWDYSGGISTDLFVHLLTSLHYVLDAKAPASVTATGELYRWKDTHEVPDTVNAILRYPEGFTVNLSSTFNNQSSGSGVEILGTRGSLAFRGGRLTLAPENVYEDNRWVVDSWKQELADQYYSRPDVRAAETPSSWAPEMRSEQQVWEEWGWSDTLAHLNNFFECVQSRKDPIEDALTGHRAAAGAHMVNLSLRQMRTVHWDFEKEKLA